MSTHILPPPHSCLVKSSLSSDAWLSFFKKPLRLNLELDGSYGQRVFEIKTQRFHRGTSWKQVLFLKDRKGA